MSADNYVVVRLFPDGWRWAEGVASQRVPDEHLKYKSRPFRSSIQAEINARKELEVIEYGVRVYDNE